MPEKPPETKSVPAEAEKPCSDHDFQADADETASPAGSYYYDDACGYEVYIGDDQDDEED